jgi:hypothetical protein
MGTIPRVSELSGQKYEFTIAGDEPTVDDLRRMDAIIRKDDAEFAQYFEEKYDMSATPGEGAGIANLAGEFFKGIGRGGLGLLETGALGAATLLPEEYEDPTREFIRRQGYAATQGLQPDLGLEDTRTGKFGEAVGSIAGTYAPLALGPLGVPIAAGLATGAGAGEASERARAEGTDEATRSDAALKGAGVGLTELIPFVGPLQKALRPFGVRNRILRAFEQGGIEGAQEAAANTLQNLIQQGYDPTQLLTEGNLEAAGYGAGAGGLIQLMVDLVIPNRRAGSPKLTDEEQRLVEEAAAPKEVAEAVTPEQQQIINQQAEQLAEELSPEIVGGPDGTQADGDGAASDGQGVGQPPPRDVPRSPTGTGASQRQGVGEGGETPDLFGDGDGTQPDTLEVIEEFENQALKEEEVLAEDVLPSEADAFEMAAARAEQQRKAKEPEDAAFREAAEFEAEQRETARLQAELEAGQAIDYERIRNTLSKAQKQKDAGGAALVSLPAAKYLAEVGLLKPEDALNPMTANAKVRMLLDAGPDAVQQMLEANAPKPSTTATTSETAQQQLEEAEQKAKGETPPNLKIPLVAQARVKGTAAANRQFIPEGVEPVPYEPKQEAELEPSAISTAPEPLPPLPTMEVLLELGVSQGTAAYQIAKNSLTKSIKDNDREAILADRDDILEALKKYDPKDAKVAARKDEYVAKATPKETRPEATERRDDVALERRRAIESADDAVRSAAQRDQAKALAEEKGNDPTLPDTSGAQPVSEADARAKRIVDARKEALQDPKRPSVALGNQPVRSSDVNELTENALFEEYVRNNTFIRDPISKAKVRPRTSQALSPTQLAHVAQEFGKIQAAKKAVAREQRTDDEVVAAAFKKQDRVEAARVKAFEGWLKTREQDAETLPDAELLALRKEFDDDVLVSDENGLSEFMPIPIEYVVGLDYPLDATTLTMLEDNNLGDALRQYAKTTPNPKFAPMAKALARVAGNTRVVFADVGDRIAGAFDPKTNTIVFNTNVPLTGHTLLHEMLHAATSATIANNPSAAPVQAIERIFNEVRESLPSYYGSSSLLEFVAEAFSNPKFQQQLAQLQVKGKGESAFSQIKRAIARIARSIFNVQIKNNAIQYREPISALDELELQIGSLLAPAPQYRNAEVLFNIANNPKQANKAMNSVLRNGPIFNDEGKTKYLAFMEDPIRNAVRILGQKANQILLRATPLHYLVQIGQKYFPDAKTGNLLTRLNTLMNTSAGAAQEETARVQAITNGLAKWANTHKDLAPALNKLFNESTTYEVDPELNEAEARIAYGDTEQFARWEAVRDLVVEVNKGGADGMRQYRLARNLFRDLRQKLISSLEKRLDDAGVDAVTRAETMQKFNQKLAELGTIEPYFPLGRDGDYWLYFTAPDPNTGKLEYYAESFKSDTQRQRAKAKLEPELLQNFLNSESGRAAIDGEKQFAAQRGDEAVSSMSDEQIAQNLIGMGSGISARDGYKNSSRVSDTFINSLMQGLTKAGADNKVKEDVTELILNSLPQTSYLQSFRGRKEGTVAGAVLGYNQDAITTITDRAKSLSRQIVQMNSRGEFSKISSELDAYYEAVNRSLPDNQQEAMRTMKEQLKFFADTGAFPTNGKLSRFLTGVAFNMTLGFNVSGGLVNLSQVPLIVMPYLGGKYGYGATMTAMRQAMKEIQAGGKLLSKKTRTIETVGTDENGNLITETREVPAGYSAENKDYSGDNLTQSEKDMKVLTEIAIDAGQFRRSLDQEILDIDRMSDVGAKFTKASGFFLFHGERMNREVSLIAAFKLAMARARKKNPDIDPESAEYAQMQKDAAIEAINDTEMMNGGLAAGSTPQLAQNDLGRVVFMYKRYGVSMLSLLHKLAKESLQGQSKEAKRIAAYQLAGIYGSAGVLAGVAGMPLYGMASLIFDTFADDEDDPMDDADTIVRTYLGEAGFRGGLNYVTGINFASRVGLGELLFRDTFIRSDNPLLYQALEYAGGPIVGIFAQAERGVKLFGEGEFYRGFEAMSPAAIKNGMKAVRYATEGVETVGGDKIIEDLHPAHIGLQTSGLAPAEYSRQLEENAVLKGADRATARRKKKLLDMYFRNYFDGADNSSVLRKISKYNQEHPNDPITAETIRRSRKTRISGKQSRYHGVTFSPKRRDEYMLYAQQFDKNSSLFM